MLIRDSSHAGAAASAVLVGRLLSGEAMPAPRAKFTTVGLRALPGAEEDVRKIQRNIRLLRLARLRAPADRLHAEMVRDLMAERWRDVALNTVTTVGKNDLLDKYFAGSAYTAAWFVGLISSVSYSAIAAADTMASHAGWTEAGGTNAPAYSGNRPAQTWANAASAGTKTTSAASSFTFTSGGTIKGMFSNTVTTKDGTTGVMYNAVLFTGGDRAVVSTDVVNVTTALTIT
jgi:hypothetical protein